MDPARVYVLVVGIVATGAFITLAAGIFHFKVDPGFWGFLGVVVGFLGTVVLKSKTEEKK